MSRIGKSFKRICIFGWLFILVGMSFPTRADAPSVAVLTNRYDNIRSGANLKETILNTSNVNVKTFGKLFSRAVVGNIYAQPLYYPNLVLPNNGTHNVIFIATADNNVYAFDADDPAQSKPLWEINLGPFFTRNLSTNDILEGHDGILGTPVIDPTSQTMYLVSHHDTGVNKAKHTLHALDITTGKEKTALGSPFDVQASLPSNACETTGGVVTFNSTQQLQRPGLLLLKGTLYVAFGSTSVSWPWHGWLMAYNASNIRQRTALFNTSAGPCNIVKVPNGTDPCTTLITPNKPASGYGGSFWQSGAGIATDDTSIFGVTGNGSFNANLGGSDYGDSLLKFSPTLTVQDYFTPYNQLCLDLYDLDLGVTGALIPPESNLVITGGKQGKIYIVDRRKMGHINKQDDNQIVQSFMVGEGTMYSTPIYWNGPNGPVLFTWNQYDYLKMWSFKPFKDGISTLVTTPISKSTFVGFGGPPGGIFALSAKGNDLGTGIVWGTQQTDLATHAAILRAWDANDLSKELWDSDMAPNGRDAYGKIAKFVLPTIANGKVYMATFSNVLNVYGLLPQPG